MKIHRPFRDPSAGADVVWRVEAKSYSYVIDADREEYGSTAPRLELYWHQPERRTPKGAIIDGQFTLLSAKRSRWRNTPDEALASFIARRKSQIRILERQLQRAEFELALTDDGSVANLLGAEGGR